MFTKLAALPIFAGFARVEYSVLTPGVSRMTKHHRKSMSRLARLNEDEPRDIGVGAQS